jgi:NAD-dependent deacetylase
MISTLIEDGRRLVDASSRVVVLTGAGVSTASGIPDFRGPNGLWTKDPSSERLSHIDAYMVSAKIRKQAWQQEINKRAADAQPNPAHVALVDFERTGKLTAIITQNIDGLHVAAGSDLELVIEVHGHARECSCLRCGARTPTPIILSRVTSGDLDPHCDALVNGAPCGGVLKTTVVSFGQQLPAQEFARAEYLAKTCDLLICVGSTLEVQPVSNLVPKALSRGAKLIIVNAQMTPFDVDADVILRGDIPTVLGPLLGS